MAIADWQPLELLTLHAHGAAAAMIGTWYARLATITGDTKYLDWSRQVHRAMRDRQFVTGGIGESLAFDASPDESDLHDETCQTAWWMFFNLALWQATGDTGHLDLVERIFFNHFLFQQLHRGEDAGFSAMGDIDQGCRGSHNYICCDNEGFHALHELLRHAVTVDNAGRTIDMHLILPCEMSAAFADGIVSVRQESDYPVRGEARFRIMTHAPAAFTLRVRIPGWTRPPGVYLNGTPVACRIEGAYVAVERAWSDRDALTVVFPLPMRVEADMTGAGADAAEVTLDGVTQPARRVAVLSGPVVAAIFRAGHGNDVSWVWTGDYPEILDTGGCPHLGYPASKPDYLLRDGDTLHAGGAYGMIADTAGLPILRWTAYLGEVRVEHAVTVLPGLPLTLEHRETITGWDGRGALLCAGIRYALRKTKRNPVYRDRLHQRAYPEPMVTTKPDISDITHEEYGNGTFSRYERLDDGAALPVTGSLRLENGCFRTICRYDAAPVAQVVCRRTEDWVGIYLRPTPAETFTLTCRLVFPLARQPLCQTAVKQQEERARQAMAALDGDTLTLTGPLLLDAPALIPRLAGLEAGITLCSATTCATLYPYDADYFIARVHVPGVYRVVTM